MKKILVFAAMIAATICIGPSWSNASVMIANWTFETYTSGTTTGSDSPVLFAEAGIQSGTAKATGRHASNATSWSNPVGNASAESFSSNTWASGDYYQFEFSTIGVTDLTIEFDQFRSSSGPQNFQIQWSSDGLTFNNLAGGAYSVLSTPSWSSGGTRNGLFTNTFDLSSITAINNLSSAFIRLTTTSSPAAGGTSRIDNVLISAVPEPSAILLVGSIIGAGLLRRRRA